MNQVSTALPSTDDLLLLDDSVADYCARALGIRRLRELRTGGQSFDRAVWANLVGEINQGWTIAKALLGHERLFVGSPKLCQHALNQLRQLARHKNMAGDAVFVDALARAALDVWDLEALYAEFAELAKAGKEFGADVALLKIWSTEIYQRLSEMIFAASGEFAAIPGAANDSGVDALAHYYNARPAPIYAGSNEIQRNIIARHTLKLPA